MQVDEVEHQNLFVFSFEPPEKNKKLSRAQEIQTRSLAKKPTKDSSLAI
tara:strand:- start:2646 stop:2792 length:147 start_codon:yes stop_codon:yes gene_type:complete